MEPIDDQIRRYILRDGRGPGDRIETEEALASTFQLSRHQVRRVLNKMVHEGVLTKSPRRGTFIRDFDPTVVATNIKSLYQVSGYSFEEFIEARLVIERAVLPLAIKRITPEQISRMRDSIHRMLQLESDPAKADEADRDFHLILLGSCGNNILSSFTTVIAHLFHESAYRRQYWHPKTIRRLAKEHERILEAIEAGDTQRALDYHDEHLHSRRKLGVDVAKTKRSKSRNWT